MRSKLIYILLFTAVAVAWTVAGCTGPAFDAAAPPMDQFTIEDVPIWRLRLVIEVGDVDDAGTDDYVWTRFQPDAENFYLDYGRDDFTRGSRHAYDISNLAKVLGHSPTCSQPNPALCTFKVRDIEELTIGLKGDDGIYLKRVDILVNNSQRPIFTHTFNPGRWLDSETGYTPTVQFSSADLRGNSYWTLDKNSTLIDIPHTLSRGVIESMFEGYAGDFIAPTPAFWADRVGNPDLFGDHVVAERVSEHRLSFTAYFGLDAPAPLLNPTMDMFFDLDGSCPDGKLKFKATNFDTDVDYSLALNIFSLGIAKAVEEYAQNMADNMIAPLEGLSFHVNVPICSKGTFNSNGDFEIY